jgi:hypothetical protein
VPRSTSTPGTVESYSDGRVRGSVGRSRGSDARSARHHASVGFESGNRLQILVVKEFTCADGSGTFSLLFRVHLTFELFSDTFTWSVVDGTGA